MIPSKIRIATLAALAFTLGVASAATTYTWTGAGDPNPDGSLNWSNPTNWGKTAATDFPGKATTDIATFPATTEATVVIDITKTIGTLNLDGTGLTLKRAAENRLTTSTLSVAASSVVTLDGAFITSSVNSAMTQGDHSVLTLKNGADLYRSNSSGAYNIYSSTATYDARLIVESGSTLRLAGSFCLNALAEVTIDDATIQAANIYLNNGGTGGGRVMFKGRHPAMRATTTAFRSEKNADRKLGTDLWFVIPEGGFDAAPLRGATGEMFLNADKSPDKAVRFHVDPTSPALTAGTATTAFLGFFPKGTLRAKGSLLADDQSVAFEWRTAANEVATTDAGAVTLWATVGEGAAAPTPQIEKSELSPAVFSSSISRKTITASVAVLGLGNVHTPKLTLLVGTENNVDALTPVETVSPTLGVNVFTWVAPNYDTKYYFAFRLEDCDGETVVSSATTAIANLTSSDATTYTWTGAGDGKSWTDPDNWDDGHGGDSLGWPQTTASTALFAEGTTASVLFDATCTFGTLNVSATKLNLTFTAGEGVAVTSSAVTAGSNAATASILSSVTFDGVSFYTSGTCSLNPGLTLRIRGGAAMSFDKLEVKSTKFVIPETVLRVEDESTLAARTSLDLNGNGCLSISDAAVTLAKLLVNSGTTTGGGFVRFEGTHPLLTVTGTAASEENASRAWGGCFDFLVPVGGFEATPFVHTGSAKLLACTKCTTRNKFRVLAESPAVRAGGAAEYTLVSTTAGVATDRISCPAPDPEKGVTALSADEKSVVYTQYDAADAFVVEGAPYAFGEGYGAQFGLAEGTVVNAPAPTSEHLTCTGYRLYDVAADGTRTEVEGSPFAGTSYAYAKGAGKRVLVWQWQRPTVYVAPEGDDGASGADWEQPLATIQAAIAKYDCSRVVVSNGTYKFCGDPITLTTDIEIAGFGASPADVTIERTNTEARIVYMTGKYAVLTNLTVSNGMRTLAGGIEMTDGLVTGCNISRVDRRNLSGDAGGFKMSGGTVRNCTITHCVAHSSGNGGSKGGGVYMTGGLVENCRIVDNNWRSEGGSGSGGYGGGVYMTGGTVRGCLIAGNQARGRGFGIYATGGTIESCTIADNDYDQTSTGTGVYLDGAGIKFRNNIVWNNTNPNGLANISFATAIACQNCNSDPVISRGSGNVSVDPVFNDDYTLNFSACVNGGLWQSWMEGAKDLAGNDRLVGTAPDIGCLERPAGTGVECSFTAETDGAKDSSVVTLAALVDGDTDGIVYTWRVWDLDTNLVYSVTGSEYAVAKPVLGANRYKVRLDVVNGKGKGNFSEIEDACTVYATKVYVNAEGTDTRPYATVGAGAHDFAKAFELLTDGGTVYVADGVYQIADRILLGNGNGTRVVSLNGPENCVIQAAKSPNFYDLAFRMFEMTAANSRLEGLTIAGGLKGRYNTGSTYNTYGNVIIKNASAMVTNCVICDASGVARGPDGAGVNISSGTIVDTTIANVEEVMSGGTAKKGVALYQTGGLADRIRIVNCRTSGTSSSEGDGGLLFVSGGTIRNSLIASCKSTQSAPVYVGADATMENCSIVANTNTQMAATRTPSTGTVANNHCGGLIAAAASTVVNTLVADNWSSFGNAESNLYCSASKEFDHCLVSDREMLPGENNLTAKPRFKNPGLGDWHLQKSSSGVNSGKTLDWMENETDIVFGERIVGSAPDIGCYETIFTGSFIFVR